MLLKSELMLLKCLFNENTHQNGVLIPTKCVERVLNNSCLVSIILDIASEFFHKTMFMCNNMSHGKIHLLI